MTNATKRRSIEMDMDPIPSMAVASRPVQSRIAYGKVPGASQGTIGRVDLKSSFQKRVRKPKASGGTAGSGPRRTFHRASMVGPITGRRSRGSWFESAGIEIS